MATVRVTGKEIRDLAAYAGFHIDDQDYSKEDLQELDESEFTLFETDTGKPWKMRSNDDDDDISYYHTVVVCDGCDVGEAYPLGDKINE